MSISPSVRLSILSFVLFRMSICLPCEARFMAISTSVFCTQKKHIIFFGQPHVDFHRGIQQPRLLLLLELHIYTPASGLGILAFEIFGHCSAQTIWFYFLGGSLKVCV